MEQMKTTPIERIMNFDISYMFQVCDIDSLQKTQ
jgi:hypothetical protein